MNVYLETRNLDKHRCRVWGCGRRVGLESHHIIPRSQGGPDKVWNLITLCSKHHNLITSGLLKDVVVLKALTKKRDFRWGKALAWHTQREQIRNKGL